jgi:hypothetical protein
MATMRAIQVARAGGPLELVEREIPAPRAGTVRTKVQASGRGVRPDDERQGAVSRRAGNRAVAGWRRRPLVFPASKRMLPWRVEKLSRWARALRRIWERLGVAIRELSLDSPFVSAGQIPLRQNCRKNQLLFRRLGVISTRGSRQGGDARINRCHSESPRVGYGYAIIRVPSSRRAEAVHI